MKEVAEQGKFGQLLMRSNTKLRQDRGLKIVKDTEKKYRRTIEDLQDNLENLEVDRDNMLDINPSNAQTIINPSDFESDLFVKKDIEIGLKVREVKIKLEVAKERYADLFEAEYQPETREA